MSFLLRDICARFSAWQQWRLARASRSAVRLFTEGSDRPRAWLVKSQPLLSRAAFAATLTLGPNWIKGGIGGGEGGEGGQRRGGKGNEVEGEALPPPIIRPARPRCSISVANSQNSPTFRYTEAFHHMHARLVTAIVLWRKLTSKTLFYWEETHSRAFQLTHTRQVLPYFASSSNVNVVYFII